MSFTTLHFYVFLVLLAFALSFIKDNAGKKNLLLAASYYFYMSWDWRFAALLFLMSTVNYYCGYRITASPEKKKTWLAISIFFSISVLGIFKYLGFFVDSIGNLAALVGLSSHTFILEIILPVGISFYTFQALSYTIDIYKGEMSNARSLRDFMLFVSFFPQLVAGPIVRAKFFLPQLDSKPSISDSDKSEALFLILKGLIKKILLADTLAMHIVDPAFASPELMSSSFLLIAVFSYSFQVYLDFSAYTDIARGAAKLIGYELPVNFNRPYLAHSVSDFWQRWHISMSSFFRDYLYFSLGGSTKGNVYVNLIITFVVIGLWHGAGWNFVLYGLAHGIILGIERKGRSFGFFQRTGGLSLIVAILRTFLIVALLRIIFRAGELASAKQFIVSLIQNPFYNSEISLIGFLALFVAICAHVIPNDYFEKLKQYFVLAPSVAKGALTVALIYLLIPFSSGDAPFIYFQF